MKAFLNIVLLLAVILSTACASEPQQEQTAAEPEVSARGPLEGVWSITEAIVTSADGTSTTIEGQPGLYMFTDRYYSTMLVETDSHLPFPSQPTDEERLAAYDNFIANAGPTRSLTPPSPLTLRSPKTPMPSRKGRFPMSTNSKAIRSP
jgi:hypothetical protein